MDDDFHGTFQPCLALHIYTLISQIFKQKRRYALITKPTLCECGLCLKRFYAYKFEKARKSFLSVTQRILMPKNIRLFNKSWQCQCLFLYQLNEAIKQFICNKKVGYVSCSKMWFVIFHHV